MQQKIDIQDSYFMNNIEDLKLQKNRVAVNKQIMTNALENNRFTYLTDKRLFPLDNQNDLPNILNHLIVYDKGSKLVDLCLIDLDPKEIPSKKVLHIGNQGLNEILSTIGYGVNIQNVHAAEVISYHPIVTLCNMRELPFEDKSFDIVIASWILNRVMDPSTLTKEILRVLKPGGKIAFGLTDQNLYIDSKDLRPKINTANIDSRAIEQLLNKHSVFKIMPLIKRDPSYPYNDWGAETIYICEVGECKVASNRIATLEMQALERLIYHYSEHYDPVIVSRIRAQQQFCITKKTLPQNYLAMRQIYAKYGRQIDDHITQQVGKLLPPFFLKAENSISTLFDKDKLEALSIAEQLSKDGIYIFKSKLQHSVIEKILQSLTFTSTETSRAFANEECLLENQTIVDLWLDPLLLTIAEQYFHSSIILDFLSATRTSTFLNSSATSLSEDAQLWHFDKDRTSFLKVFVYLTDVEQENGPHEYIKGSHKIPPTRDGRFSDTEIFSRHSKSSVARIIGEAGTIFIEDTHGIHRGTPVNGGTRTILQLEYASSLFGQEVTRKSIKYFTPRYKELIRDYPRLFSRFDVD